MTTGLDLRDCEIDFKDRLWTIHLARACRRVQKVMIKNFQANSRSLDFVKTMSHENRMGVRWSENFLVMERDRS
jgi:hypothetical protein